MFHRTVLVAAAMSAVTACAEIPDRTTATAPAASAPPTAAETSASSPMTVNPEPSAGAPLPQTPPTAPTGDPSSSDAKMAPGPVN